MAEPAPTSERIEGPTPSGGVATLILYRDAEGNPAPKDVAVGAEVIELDDAGNHVGRTYADLRPESTDGPADRSR